MYIYLISFQSDINITLLPPEKSPKKAKKLSGLIVPKKAQKKVLSRKGTIISITFHFLATRARLSRCNLQKTMQRVGKYQRSS